MTNHLWIVRVKIGCKIWQYRIDNTTQTITWTGLDVSFSFSKAMYFAKIVVRLVSDSWILRSTLSLTKFVARMEWLIIGMWSPLRENFPEHGCIPPSSLPRLVHFSQIIDAPSKIDCLVPLDWYYSSTPDSIEIKIRKTACGINFEHEARKYFLDNTAPFQNGREPEPACA